MIISAAAAIRSAVCVRPLGASRPPSLAAPHPRQPAPGLRHPLCALRTTVPPPDTRAGVTPPATISSRAYPATGVCVSGTSLAAACAGMTTRAVACVSGAPLALACAGRTPRAVARAIPPVVARVEVTCAAVACAGAFPRPSRAPWILAEPNRPAVLARAHGAILKICYKIVNKLHEGGDHVSWNLRHPHPRSPLSPGVTSYIGPHHSPAPRGPVPSPRTAPPQPPRCPP